MYHKPGGCAPSTRKLFSNLEIHSKTHAVVRLRGQEELMPETVANSVALASTTECRLVLYSYLRDTGSVGFHLEGT